MASVVLLALNSARAKSRDAKRLADMKQMATALELYFNDNATYPTGATDSGVKDVLDPGTVGKFPTAPLPQDGNCSATQNAYTFFQYSTSAATSGYNITFCLGNAPGAYIAGPHTLTQAGIQ